MSRRRMDARRTLWLALPVFALASWATAMSTASLAPRMRLYVALLAGMVALGVWLGLRRWRRAPGLASGFASLPEGDAPFLERVVVPALAGVLFWPWLLIETVRDMQLASRLRSYVPEENRASSFGFGEASLAFASLAAAFTLGTHGLSNVTPVAGKLWEGEAKLANRAQEAVRKKLGNPVNAQVGSVAAPAVHEEAPPPEAPAAEAPAAEAPAAAAIEPTVEAPPPLPEVPEEPVRETRGHHARKLREPAALPEPAPVEEEPTPVTAHHEEEEEPAPPPRPLDRRFVPGSEMAKQAQSGKGGPEGYVTSSGRVVIKAPPPPAN